MPQRRLQDPALEDAPDVVPPRPLALGPHPADGLRQHLARPRNVKCLRRPRRQRGRGVLELVHVHDGVAVARGALLRGVVPALVDDVAVECREEETAELAPCSGRRRRGAPARPPCHRQIPGSGRPPRRAGRASARPDAPAGPARNGGAGRRVPPDGPPRSRAGSGDQRPLRQREPLERTRPRGEPETRPTTRAACCRHGCPEFSKARTPPAWAGLTPRDGHVARIAGTPP